MTARMDMIDAVTEGIGRVHIDDSEDEFGTAFLHQLRALVDGYDGTENMWRTLNLHRVRGIQIFSEEVGPEQSKEIKRLFRVVWRLFSELDDDHKYYLPPIYEGNCELNKLLDCTIDSMILRECGRINNGSSNVGHCVLGGVEGAGKSTLLQAFAFGVAILFKKLTPLYWNYDTSEIPECKSQAKLAKPAYLLKTLAAILGIVDTQSTTLEHFCSLLKKERCVYPLLLLDEFNQIYCRDENLGLRSDIANQVHAFCRRANTYCVMAGSSSQMRSLLFRRIPRVTPDEWKDFPNFNGSLFKIKHVSALRSLEQLKAYILSRYPTWNPNDATLSRIFMVTGGVGRFVHELYLNTTNHEVNDAIELSIQERARKTDPDIFFQSSSSFQLLIYALTVISNDDKCIGVPYRIICDLLYDAKFVNPQCEIERWVDSGMVYLLKDQNDFPSEVQINIPLDLHNLRRSYNKDNSSNWDFWGMVMMIVGGRTQAGTPMEDLLRSGVYTLFKRSNLKYSCDVLEIKEGRLYVTENDKVSTIANVTNLQNKFFKWKNETGVDGIAFSFTRNSSMVETYICYLNVWQNKGGHYNLELGGGDIMNSRNVYIKNKRATDIDDSRINGILVKAEIGVAKIIVALLDTISCISQIKFESILITTSKKGFNAEKSLNKMGYVYQFNRDLLQPSQSEKLQKDYTQIKFVHGLGWIQTCVPSSFSNLFPPGWVELVESLSGSEHRKVGCLIA